MYAIVRAVAVVLLAALAAAVPAQQKDEIHLATVNSNYRKALEKIAREYEALHPDVTVRVSIITNEYSTWLRTQFAGGEKMAPDIYNGNYTAEYVGLGRWTPLNDYLETTSPYTQKPWIKSLNRKLVERFYYGSTAYYVPIDYIDVAFVYNKRVFEQLGITPPRTWTEMILVLETIRDRGREVELRGTRGQDIIPMAMSGNAKDFWEGPVGWLTRILGDAYHRREVDISRAKPGDWNFIPARNAAFSTDFADPYNDVNITINAERHLNALGDRTLPIDGPKMRAVYQRILDLSRFWPKGFLGINFGSSEALFVQQKAAILFTTSHFVTHTDRVWRGMEPADRFEWGAFPPPSITDDPLCEAPTLRGIGNAGANLVVTRKSDPEHEKRVVDFMMFLTRPESGQAFFDETRKDDQFIVGPIQIEGVKMPDELRAKYDAFLGRGFEKLDLRGTVVEYEWTLLSQELLGRRISLDDYLKQYQKLVDLRIDREKRRASLDMNPATDDEKTRPKINTNRRRWNPMENGGLVVAALALLYAGFAFTMTTRTRGLRRHATAVAFLLLTPTMLGLACFNAYPALSGLYRAFTLWEDAGVPKFTGLANFRRLFTDFLLFRSLANMVILTVANLVKSTVFPFLVAEMLLALPWPRLRYFLRTLFLAPVVVPAVTMILVWGFIYDPNVGVLNAILRAFGMQGAAWLGEPWLALPSIIGIGFPWIGAMSLLIFMSGLLQIGGEIHDAARIDCRNYLQRVWHVDVPLVGRQFKLIIIVTLIGSLQDFQTVLLMTNGGPGLATSVPALQMYQRAFKFGEYGYASSIGFVLFLLILAVTLFNLKYIRTAEAE